MANRHAAALIVAAGRGVRAGEGTPKQYRPLGGRPLLAYSIASFKAAGITDIQVVIHADDIALYKEAAADAGLPAPVFGGESRQESVRNGLAGLKARAPDLVLIHDAARPFADAGLIQRVLDALQTHDGAIPAIAVTDTLKRGEKGLIRETVARDNLYQAQTPQGFNYAAICLAHERARGTAMTDDAAVGEAAGLKVALVEGAATNIKVTSAEDFVRAEKMLSERTSTRVAMGFDVHRFMPGDHVFLCGVRIAHDAALEGHSDADAGLHAITDALLGCIGAGDIGTHFPPSDERWRGAASHLFLAHAATLVRDKGGAVEHVDVTLICERPKIGPHRAAMTERIAEILYIETERVSVKATTSERLGFTGRGEGLAAQAVCTVRLPVR